MGDYNSYNGYQLDAPYVTYELTDKEIEILDACIMIIEHKMSIRSVARNIDVPKSTVHARIHRMIKEISYELYKCVCRQLDWNRKHTSSKRR